MEAYQYVNNIKVELKNSLIHGIGTFAMCNIEKGVLLFDSWSNETGYYDVPVSKLTNKNLTEPILSKYFVKVNKTYKVLLIKDVFFLSPWRHWVNHSNTPNISSNGYSIRTIYAGEEIVRDYSHPVLHRPKSYNKLNNLI